MVLTQTSTGKAIVTLVMHLHPLKVLLFSVFIVHMGCQAPSSKEGTPVSNPNILFILADDLGYGELGCYGQEVLQTPRIDKMAAEGMRFTQFYAGSTVCAPSRGALMTGQHTGHITNRANRSYPVGAPKERIAIKPSDTTIAMLLKNAGYRTGHFGKWHLEKPGVAHSMAWNKGFDVSIGTIIENPLGIQSGGFYPAQLHKNGEVIDVPGNENEPNVYVDEFYLQEAKKFMEAPADQPFFVYVALKTVHNPIEFEQDYGPFKDKDWPEVEKKYAARLSYLDRKIGELLDFMDSSGLAENTLVLFSSDNGNHKEGGHDPYFFKSNAPLRGYKRDVYDGGIRTPMIAQWPGVVKPGSESDYVGAFWDVMPTLCELADVETVKKTDGQSFLSVLKGGTVDPTPNLYWEFRTSSYFRQAVRLGDFKVLRQDYDAPIEVYHIINDPGESNDLAPQYPGLVAKADSLFVFARVPDPSFPIPVLDSLYYARK